MRLVDYSSSSSSEDDTPPASPPCKRRKGGPEPTGLQESTMPPLPPGFHDLYASTVRQSVVDDPALHQGRKRQNPHVVGNWPSHIYVEWHPTAAQHDTLDALVRQMQLQIGEDTHLYSFLTSELGTPLPLHISLSRPLSLPGSIKDDYLSRIHDAICTSGIGRFSVKPAGLAWHKSPDSDRTFFVLRIVTATKAVPKQAGDQKDSRSLPTNPELTTLLAKCNAVAALFQQPPLYQQNAGNAADTADSADTAFHISIGWTMGSPDHDACLMAVQKYSDAPFGSIHDWEIAVEGIKAKIGNGISHIPLSRRFSGRKDGEETCSLFGI
ncbi:hypothetical protein E4U42_004855 [Claviceps africana]|uniref:U6 snRNA phosphodiesterase n=1 Tax=Claviceps africana TaxID=83212 RepID=A0A8K0J4P4_9HYPO|nr:hypothetical protein E4U42_004855 [Claviceps africana]